VKLYSDAPIANARFDSLARQPIAQRLVEVATISADLPIVIGLYGGAGTGKTSVLHMAGELCTTRSELRAFAVDAWVAADAAKVNETLVREVSQIFEEENVISSGEKVRDKLFAVGDMVSAAARFAGVKVDVKGALEKSPDALRDEVLKLAQAVGKRIIVFVDHLDRIPPADALAVLKLIARWGTFPYFAFVVAIDPAHTSIGADDLTRVITVELPLPPPDRALLAATVRGGLDDLAAARGVDPAPALALFDLDTGIGLGTITTPRAAKRYLNTLNAILPLVPARIDLRTVCLLELARIRPSADLDALIAETAALADRPS
jgi:hypothetical protein